MAFGKAEKLFMLLDAFRKEKKEALHFMKKRLNLNREQ